MEIRKINFQNECRLKTEDKKNTKSNRGLILFGSQELVEKRVRFWINTS